MGGYNVTIFKFFGFFALLTRFSFAETEPLNAYDHITKAYPIAFKELKAQKNSNDDKSMESFFANACEYAKKTYHPILHKLRNGKKCTRSSVFSAFKHDTLLRYDGQGGHDKFTCELLSITFCISGHGENDINNGEYDGVLAFIQQYTDAVKNFYVQHQKSLVKTLKSKKSADLHELVVIEKERYEMYDKKQK